MRTLLSLVVVIALASGCAGRDKADSADSPPVEPTTGAGASDSAATTSASDTSTTTRPAESVHTDTQQ